MSSSGDYRKLLDRWVKLAEDSGWTVERRPWGGEVCFISPDRRTRVLVPGVAGARGKGARSGQSILNYRTRLRRGGLRGA